QQQTPDEHRRERGPDALPALGDRAVAQVDLEEEGLPAGGADGDVDLQELVIRPLEAVLRLLEIAEVGRQLARAQGTALAGAEVEGPTNEPRLVRVEDSALRRPDLHAHDPLAQDAPAHDLVDPRSGGGVTVDETVTEIGL